MTNPYEILQCTKDSSQAELKQKYEELRKQYSEERFLDGEKGNEGAKKLMELEEAWTIIKAEFESKKNESQWGGDYGYVDNLLKEGKYDEAQTFLDSVQVRTAEWHYMQSIIFYKREWLSESRKQLAFAVSMDPHNRKYTEALEKLDSVMGSPATDPSAFGQQPYQSDMDAQSNTLCRCCQAYICMDCCCRMATCCRF
jgi:curved DNA-binding protein CbpA